MKKKYEKKPCKYCGSGTDNSSGICTTCYQKKKIMQGWHWEYDPRKNKHRYSIFK